MIVEKLTPDQWAYCSEHAHLLAFKEIKPASRDRIDFALLAIDGTTPAMYVTCREYDAETLYWQFGGAFPETLGTVKSFRAVEAFVAYVKERYARVTCLIENTNRVMLKMASKVGFKIVGIRTYHGCVLLEHLLEFGEI